MARAAAGWLWTGLGGRAWWHGVRLLHLGQPPARVAVEGRDRAQHGSDAAPDPKQPPQGTQKPPSSRTGDSGPASGASLGPLPPPSGSGLFPFTLGLPPTYISRVEGGRSLPALDVLARLAGELGVPVGELVGVVEKEGAASATEAVREEFEALLRGASPRQLLLVRDFVALVRRGRYCAGPHQE